MPRKARTVFGGQVYHVINRGNCSMEIFGKDADYLAFLQLIEEGRRRTGMRILAFCLMPNHWHMVLWPRRAADLSAFVGWISNTHVRRWRQHRHALGEGHLYQGRYKNFPIQRNEQLYRILRYVEGNARRAQLVPRAQAWPYGSLYTGQHDPEHTVQLVPWPIPRPADWLANANRRIAEAELNTIRLHIQRGRPFGADAWMRQAVREMGLLSTLRDRGRPPKKTKQTARSAE